MMARGMTMYPQWIINNKENYKFILKNNNEYSSHKSAWTNCYSCLTIDSDTGLRELAQQQRLESLKNGRTDLEICFRAMEWTFQQLLGKTQSNYTGILSASEIIKFAKSSRTTVNCLCHATVLTEVLLALGYATRKISCMPIDVVPFDNHVVTTVYVPSLKKWIMLDPSMCCYVVDQDGIILSIPEIRNQLVSEKKIYIHTYSRFSTNTLTNHYLLVITDHMTNLFQTD